MPAPVIFELADKELVDQYVAKYKGGSLDDTYTCLDSFAAG